MATVKLGDRDKVHELSLAMELLLAHKGDKWSEDQFIKRLIVSSTMKFVDNKTAEETAAKSAVVSCLLNIFISVQRIQACSPNTVSILVSQVLTKLVHKQSEDMSLELSVVEALIRASPYCPVKCLDLMRKWQDTNKGRIPAHTFSKLQFVRSTLSKMVPGKNICKS
uniref:Little elongation complex subunit 1 C-terminal domain-containing protein n=1 Tax=Biomphalaria glabrata TaxID=6526 RepID=A0A2C9LGN7_BIOGL